MKKSFLLYLWVALILALICVLASCDNDSSAEGENEYHTNYDAFLFYPSTENTYVVGISESGKYYTEITVPSTYNGGKVVGIIKEGFKECEELESITIPNTIKKIGENAFEGCTDLRTLTLSAPLTIGINAFKSTYISTVYFNGSLEEWLEVNCDGFVEIPLFTGWDSKLYLNNQLLTDLDFTDISRCDEAYIFGGLDSIKSVTIPEGYYSCPYFGGCSSLETVTIHDSVNMLFGFEYCTSLKNITIPSHVTGIYEGAFRGCSTLESISIPNSIEKIGGSAFYGCSSLKSVNIPHTVTQIGESAFANCTSLESITLPNGMAEISKSTFKGCSSLKEIVLPGALLTICNNAFEGCTSLESITLPHLISSINYQAFKDCSALKNIHYQGDKFMWNYTVTKNKEWNKNTGDYTIYCTDGNIKK